MTGPTHGAPRDRVLLDANVLFSAAYRAASGLLRLWHLKPALILLTTTYAAEEAQRNLIEEDARRRLDSLLGAIEPVPHVERGILPASIVLPPKDVPILLSALHAHAIHLLTGDRAHFGPYFGKSIHRLLIERPGDYLKRVLARADLPHPQE